jgi:hypothetical protein
VPLRAKESSLDVPPRVVSATSGLLSRPVPGPELPGQSEPELVEDAAGPDEHGTAVSHFHSNPMDDSGRAYGAEAERPPASDL